MSWEGSFPFQAVLGLVMRACLALVGAGAADAFAELEWSSCRRALWLGPSGAPNIPMRAVAASGLVSW